MSVSPPPRAGRGPAWLAALAASISLLLMANAGAQKTSSDRAGNGRANEIWMQTDWLPAYRHPLLGPFYLQSPLHELQRTEFSRFQEYQPDDGLELQIQSKRPPDPGPPAWMPESDLFPEPGAHPGAPLLLDASGLPLPLGPPGLGLGPAGGDQKLQLSLGPCLLQLYEPCTDGGAIAFYLFNTVGAASGRPAVLSVENPELPESFDPNLPTKVMFHGFGGSVEFNFTAAVRQAYLLRGGYNVLVVDWGRLSVAPCYLSSVINTWQVSRCAAQLLSRLAALSESLRPSRLHVLGFSLGAHIAAYLSNELEASTGQRVGRITGLDPALPAFATLSLSWKLDPSDADFVDVVHTNAGMLGKVEPTGHADFYVNGGTAQPFCTGGDRNVPLCSHLLANWYFAETVFDETSHWGRQCISWGLGWCQVDDTAGAFMGEGARSSVHGIFLVETAADYPFALGPPNQSPAQSQTTLMPVISDSDTVYVVLSRENK